MSGFVIRSIHPQLGTEQEWPPEKTLEQAVHIARKAGLNGHAIRGIIGPDGREISWKQATALFDMRLNIP